MSKTETTITYIGNDVHATLKAHPDVVQAVHKLCLGLFDASIKIHVMSPFRNAEPLEWTVDIASPKGRRTLAVKQRVPAGSIAISD